MKLFGEKRLSGRRIAILATNGFEESELLLPQKALEDEGAQVLVVSPEEGKITGWQKKDWGSKVKVDLNLSDADSDDFDALMLPGGVINADTIRMNKQAVAFVKGFTEAKKPIASICHASWMLIETGFVNGRTMTSWPSLRTDLINAGANWVDLEVVTDSGLVTSRMPEDIPAFNKKMIEEFAEGIHDRPTTKAKDVTSNVSMH